jgi:hypothetical protein
VAAVATVAFAAFAGRSRASCCSCRAATFHLSSSATKCGLAKQISTPERAAPLAGSAPHPVLGLRRQSSDLPGASQPLRSGAGSACGRPLHKMHARPDATVLA